MCANDFGFAPLTPTLRRWVARAASTVQRWSVVYSDTDSAHLLRRSVAAINRTNSVRSVPIVGGEMPWVRWAHPQFNGLGPPQTYEAVLLFCHTGERHWNGSGMRDSAILQHKCLRGANKHKTEKPLDQALDLVAWYTDPGETVFDPFAGRGTIGLACRILGRKYVGTEIDRRECDLACARITNPALSDRDRARVSRWATATLVSQNKRLRPEDRATAEACQK